MFRYLGSVLLSVGAIGCGARQQVRLTLERTVVRSPVDAVVADTHGTYVAARTGSRLTLYDARTWRPVASTKLRPASVYLMVYTPSGRLLVAGDNLLHELRLSGGRLVARPLLDAGLPVRTIGPNGTVVAGTYGQARLCVGKVRRELPEMGPLNLFAFSPDGRYIVRAGAQSLTTSDLAVVDATTGKTLRRAVLDEGDVRFLAWPTSGGLVAYGETGWVARLDPQHLTKTSIVRGHHYLTEGANVSPDGTWLLTGGVFTDPNTRKFGPGGVPVDSQGGVFDLESLQYEGVVSVPFSLSAMQPLTQNGLAAYGHQGLAVYKLHLQ